MTQYDGLRPRNVRVVAPCERNCETRLATPEHSNAFRCDLGRKTVMGVDAPHPPRRKHARHHQRHASPLPPPGFEEVTHGQVPWLALVRFFVSWPFDAVGSATTTRRAASAG